MKHLLLLAILAAAPAAAQTQRQIDADAARDYARADAALNVAYRAAVARARAADAEPGARLPNPGYQAALLTAQRAWLVFRDAECRNQGYSYFGGTMEWMTATYCKQELTEQRTKQLQPRPEGE